MVHLPWSGGEPIVAPTAVGRIRSCYAGLSRRFVGPVAGTEAVCAQLRMFRAGGSTTVDAMSGVSEMEHRLSAPDDRPNALIELSAVARRYAVGTNVVVALADVSVRVAAEDFVVVLGPSGSGKTTLLNIIGALDSPSEGRVVVAGRDITRASRKELFAFRRQGVSFVFQTSRWSPGPPASARGGSAAGEAGAATGHRRVSLTASSRGLGTGQVWAWVCHRGRLGGGSCAGPCRAA
jgi:hypothetical protein